MGRARALTPGRCEWDGECISSEGPSPRLCLRAPRTPTLPLGGAVASTADRVHQLLSWRLCGGACSSVRGS
eukprot:1326457-Pyramimonas_sp.AAC.1